VYFEAGRHDKAAAELNAALAVTAQFPWAADASALLEKIGLDHRFGHSAIFTP
jgi:hypothetical protein